MSPELWRLLAARLDEHSYMHGVERTVERVRATAEVFTPTGLVLEMLSYLDLDVFAPGRTVLDPACGDGQFLVAAKWVKVLHHAMTPEDAVAELYGVDLMRDNVDLCRLRLGGGTIVVGNTLDPAGRVPGQTDAEHATMLALFAEAGSSRPRKDRAAHAGPGERTGARSAGVPVRPSCLPAGRGSA